MQLKSIFLSIPRDTIKTLTHYHLLPKNTLLWYDLITFFDQLGTRVSPPAQAPSPQKPNKPLSTMQKYTITADKHHLSEEQTRKIIARLNQYI